MYEYTKHFNRDLLANVCTGSQLKFREVYIPQYDRPYRYVQPQRVWFFVLVKKRVLYYGLLLPILVFNEATRESVGGKGGAVVRALASQQCGPGSNPGVDAICGLSSWFVVRSPSPFVVGSFPCSERFFSGAPVFPSPQKPTIDPIRSGTHGHI